MTYVVSFSQHTCIHIGRVMYTKEENQYIRYNRRIHFPKISGQALGVFFSHDEQDKTGPARKRVASLSLARFVRVLFPDEASRPIVLAKKKKATSLGYAKAQPFYILTLYTVEMRFLRSAV